MELRQMTRGQATDLITKHTRPDCWGWDGPAAHQGYGLVWDGESQHLAHRVAWVAHFGPIPDGMFVLHRCDSRSCTKPSHLFLGTNADNMRDMHRKGRGRGRTALNWDEEDEIIKRWHDGESQRALAREFGLSPGGVGAMLKRRGVYDSDAAKRKGGPPKGHQLHKKRLSESEIREALKMRHQGRPVAKIAAFFDYTTDGMRKLLHRELEKRKHGSE